MPFRLCLPANEIQSSARMPQATIGDPGHTELFAFPQYAYIFLLRKQDDEWKVYQCMEETLTDEDWKLHHYGGSLASNGDLIYFCTKKIRVLLSERGVKQRVYAIASSIPLTFNKTLSISAIPTLDDLLELTIDVSADETQRAIHNIYSSPYNYDHPETGEYYGSFTSTDHGVVSLDMMLYHIASKVDLKWSVEESVRVNSSNPSEAVRLTYLGVRNLLNGNVYAFKPTENTVATLPSSGYNIPNIVTKTDESLWWEGRTYFYTIPFRVTGSGNYFPIQLTLRTNGNEEGSGYQLTLNQPYDPTSPFVPWIRGNITLSQPLVNKSETKTIGD